jgi:hypothetical protein
MYPGFKELIEEKSEISLGASYWDAAVDEAVNPSPAAIDWDHRRIASAFIAGRPQLRRLRARTGADARIRLDR